MEGCSLNHLITMEILFPGKLLRLYGKNWALQSLRKRREYYICVVDDLKTLPVHF